MNDRAVEEGELDDEDEGDEDDLFLGGVRNMSVGSGAAGIRAPLLDVAVGGE